MGKQQLIRELMKDADFRIFEISLLFSTGELPVLFLRALMGDYIEQEVDDF